MLASRGSSARADRDELLKGLDAVELELTVGQFAVQAEDEGIHMAIEPRLTEVAGAVAGGHGYERTTLARPASGARC